MKNNKILKEKSILKVSYNRFFCLFVRPSSTGGHKYMKSCIQNSILMLTGTKGDAAVYLSNQMT